MDDALQQALARRQMTGAGQQVPVGQTDVGSAPVTSMAQAMPAEEPETELMVAIKALSSFIQSESKAKREALQYQMGGLANADNQSI